MRLAILLILALTLQACASAPPKSHANVDRELFGSRDWTLAVVDLDYAELEGERFVGAAVATSGGADAGRIVGTLLAGELGRLGNITVVERGQLEKLLAEQELQMSGMVSASTAVELGEMIGADAVVVGDLSEYVTWTSIGINGSTVSFAIRMIDVSTGRVVVSGSISRVESYKTPFQNAQNLVRELVGDIEQD